MAGTGPAGSGSWIALGLLARGPERHGERLRALDPVRGGDTLVEVCAPVFHDPRGLRPIEPERPAPAAASIGTTPAGIEPVAGVRIPDRAHGLAGLAPGRHGRQAGPAGVIVSQRHAQLAHLAVRDGQTAGLAAALDAGFGIALPAPGKRTVGNGLNGNRLALTAVGPGQWFAELTAVGDAAAEAGIDIEAALRPVLGAFAAIVDQSHARIVLRLEGRKVRDILAAGLPLDLHPRAFGPGDAAQSLIAQIGVLIWQRCDTAPDPAAPDDGPIYELAIPRSTAGSFGRWLMATAARYGLDVRGADGGA